MFDRKICEILEAIFIQILSLLQLLGRGGSTRKIRSDKILDTYSTLCIRGRGRGAHWALESREVILKSQIWKIRKLA